MASYTAVISAVESAVFDAKKQVINDFMRFLEDKIDFDDDMKGYFTEFIDTLKAPKKTSPKKASKKSDEEKVKKPKRAPSAYNMFISEKMAEIKKENPALKGKELMKAAIEVWNEQKKAAASAKEEVEDKVEEEVSKTKSKSKPKKESKKKEPEPEPEPESESESEPDKVESSEDGEEFD